MLFRFEDEKSSDSLFIEKIWCVQSGEAGEFISHATARSGIVVTKYQGQTMVTVRGPETRATLASMPSDGEFFGIDFKVGTFLPSLLPKTLTERRDVNLPITNRRAFWLDSSVWEIPNFDNADTFVKKLVHEGLLAHDPVVNAVLQGHPQAFSPRALQYHFVRATGLSLKAIQQIERAQQALTLLQHGTPISEIAHEIGYFDQSHMTNALKRFLGQTPAQITRANQPD